jgi:hypothetical protein
VQVERCTAGGGYIIWERLGQSTHGGEIHGRRRIQYIIWERLGQSTHGGYPCTGGEMYMYSPIRGSGIRGSAPLEVQTNERFWH